MIKIKNLSKHFMGVRAIDNLSVEILQGITTALIGPNGSGKTTLMNVLTGVLSPDDGEIKICNDRERSRIKPDMLRKLKIARTFQDGRLIEQLSVEDNLLLAVAENGYWKSLFDFRKHSKLAEILQIVNLSKHHNRAAGELSYGQRKLLEIGRALIQGADIYFFDEPFAGLFPDVVEHVIEIMQSLKKQKKTLIIIEHNMDIIEKLCDEVIVLDSGKLLAQGKPQTILNHPLVKEAYLGI